MAVINSIYIIEANRVLVKYLNEDYQLPLEDQIDANDLINAQRLLMDKSYLIAGIKHDADIPDGFAWKPVREVARKSNKPEIRNIAYAASQINWDIQTKFCGKCGSLNEPKSDEHAKICSCCRLVIYPRISPAIIVAIVKDGELLLAHNSSFPDGFYSVLAGFMNPGETFEDCVKREVIEEVGINLKKIRYFGNQPWPYPDSHMVAFTAEYESGEIMVDNNEILTASWFKPNDLPAIPGKNSISRGLIDWFVEKYS